MAEIAKKIGNKGLKDFITIKQAAEKLKLKVPTLKRWISKGSVSGVVWGKNRRGWIIVHRDSIPLIRQYRDKIDLKKTP